MAAAQEKPDQKSAEKNKKSNDVSSVQKWIDFLQKNRKALFIGSLAVILIFIGSIVGIAIRDRIREDAFNRIDAFNQRYVALRVHNDNGSEGINALLEEIGAFAARNSGFAAARAFSLSAAIYWEQERWTEAERAWTSALNASPRSYLAPISLYNAAAAAEEHGNFESAIELYTQVLEYEDVFFIAARAQFSIGRLQEARNNREAALAAYRSLLSRWPHDPLWSNLAQSRIMLLSD